MFTIFYIDDDGSNKGTLCQTKHIFKYQYMYVHIFISLCNKRVCISYIDGLV